jgi:manganese/iron transport system permease protein
MSLIDFVLEPLNYPFMLRGLLAAVMVGIVCPTVGTYMVLRGMAFFGDALAHAILPGIALGYLVGGGARGPLFWWGLVTAILTSVGIGALSKGARIKEDTAIGIVFAGMFALGIALISTVRNYTADLTHFLFGDVLGVTSTDLWLTGIFGMIIVATVLLFYKEFLIISFDPTLASTLRIPSRFFDYLLYVLIAVAAMVSLQTVGVSLMVAMLITPAATAYLLTRRLPIMMALAATIGAGSGIIGLYVSFYLNIASGPAIVLTATAFFAAAWIGRSLQGAVQVRAHT